MAASWFTLIQAAAISKLPSGHQVLLSTPSPYYSLFRPVKAGLIFLSALASICLINQSQAQENTREPWVLEADHITFHQDPQQITADGKVILRHIESETDAPIEIRADTMTYNSTDSKLSANGNVSLEELHGTTSADAAQFDLRNRTGKLTSTTISLADQEIKFSGKFVEKIENNRYIFYDGTFTSCQTEDDESPDWSINSREADVTIDGMAFLKHATFKVKKMPLLYFPYLVLPAKITRQTGLLFPEISHSSRDGSGGITPFFINLSPSSDLTFYPGYYEKRGAFSGMEFRHVNDYSSKASFSINYQEDRTEDSGPIDSENSADDYRQDGYLRTNHNRYWIRGKADQFFSQYSALRLDIDAVSDQDFIHEYREGITGFDRSNKDYIKDFNRGLQEASLNFRESILQFTSRSSLSNVGLEFRYVDDALSDITEIEPVQTLPRIIFSSWTPIKTLPVSFAWDSEYVYYRPEEGIGYQRLDLLPRLTMPTPFGSRIEGTIMGGFRETIYNIESFGNTGNDWDQANSIHRGAWEFSTNTATILARDFNLDPEHQLTHTFRPNLIYSYLDSSGQDELPDLDDLDLLTESNNLTVELNNYFQSSQTQKTTTETRQVGYIKFSQSYDLTEARRELTDSTDKHRPFSDLTMDIEIAPLSKLFFRYQTALDVYGEGINSYNLQTRYSNNRLDNLTIDYDYTKGGDRDLNLVSQLQITNKLTVSYSTTQSLQDDHTTEDSMGLLYSSQCWSIKLTNTRESDDRRLMLTFSLTGIGTALETRISDPTVEPEP